MTPLRAKMIKAMQVRGFSIRTHESYLYAVSCLARYYRRAPDQLGIEGSVAISNAWRPSVRYRAPPADCV